MAAEAIGPSSWSCRLGTSGLYLSFARLTWAGKANEDGAKGSQAAKVVGLLPNWEAEVLSRTVSPPEGETHQGAVKSV